MENLGRMLQQFGTNGAMITYAIMGLIIILGIFAFAIWLRVSDLKRIYNQRKIFIEVTPPLDAGKTPEATERLFATLHSACTTQKFGHRLLRRSNVVVLEVVSSRRDGVRYIITAPEQAADAVERSITAFSSNCRIKRIDDPTFAKSDYTKVKEFRQTKHFALPIRTLETFEQHDSISYITNAMNRLVDGEQMTMQLVLTPARVRNMGTIVQRYFEFYKISDANHNKAYGHLFKSELRVRVVALNQTSLDERMHGIESAITSFSIPKVQTLKVRYNFPESVRGRFREWAFTHRMPALLSKNSNIFSSLELANLYHFPASQTMTESVVKSLSRTLAAPLSLRYDNDFSVILGETNHYGEKLKIGISRDERARHALYIGKTGSGKTTMLEYEILQDIENGEGVVFVDPHGDAAEGLLGKIPEHRIQDVIYFNPDDIDFPASINMLEIPEGITGNELLRRKDAVTDAVITVFRKVFSEGETGGSRNEAALRNTVQTALTVENSTLETVYKIINDNKFRTKVVAKLEDQNLRDYWLNEVGEAGGMQRVSMMKGITTKLGRFLFANDAKRILIEPKSTINFGEVLDTKKILICNLAKGKIGDDASQLFGVMILAKIQMAALQRARKKQKDRSPCYVYVDEFQNFATTSFVEMLAEARKYGLSMNMAQQTLSQQKDEQMINTIVMNSGTIVIFQTVSRDDEKYIGHLFRPFINEGEIQNLPAFNFYARLSAIKSQEPVSGQTIVPEQESDPDIERRVIESSRALYARPYATETSQEAPETTKNKNMNPRVQVKRKPAIEPNNAPEDESPLISGADI